MEELIARIATATGLDKDRAEKAVGTVLALVSTQGDKAQVEKLFAAVPGAAALAAQHGGDAARTGGMMGILAGA
jgi:hypothetical protein